MKRNTGNEYLIQARPRHNSGKVRSEKEILKGMIRDGDSKIHINWKQTKQLLVNEHLPVWFANTYVQKFCRFPLCRRIHELQQNFVKKHIGEFIFYHDIETMSAVVYFKNTKTICGVVDIRYIIRDMPISECDQGHQVGGPYVKLRDNTLNVHDHLKMFGFPTHGNDDSSQDEDELGSPGGYEIPRKRQRLYDYSDERRVTTLYPEILIFVPYNMIEYVKQFIGLMSAPAHILKYYIVHFNCIDMLLAKLSTNQIKIHLNIAGIVFEGQDNIFDFMKYINVPFGVHGSNPIRYIDASSTFESITSYINKNQITFPEDSYDFYFIPTGTELLVNGDVCAGASIELDYYKIRKTVPSLIRNRIGMLVQHSIESDYVITAHELGHLMFLKHEPQTKGYQNGIKQCYAIMQETYPYCIDCLKWTKENIEDLKKFVKFGNPEKDILNCMIKDEETEIHLNLIKTKQLLANEHLPVWIAKAGAQASFEHNRGTVQHELQKNFMKENVGTFTLYHDVEQSSAVVYYENTRTLHGMIDTRYVIANMPVNECNRGHHAGGLYVYRVGKNMKVHDHLKPLDLQSIRHDESTSYSRESSDQYEIPTKLQRLDKTSDQISATIFYLEILIFVPYDLIEYIRESHPYNAFGTIVRRFIKYFNSVDILLAKLSTDYIKIYLNLAGIVFEDRSNVFDFMEPIYIPSNSDPSKHIRYLNSYRTLELASAYIKANRDTFSYDSFDFYFIPSKTDLWSTLLNDEIEGLSGMSEMYAGRLAFSDKYSSGCIIYHDNPSAYVTAAHEIAHLLDINHESQKKGYCDGDEQCYAIMQTTGTFCPNCLKWTDQNIEDLQKFAREHRNHCFLLNEPRSLHPHGYPMRTLSRLEQCHCYGYKHWPIKNLRDTIDEVPYRDCNQNLICGQGSREVHTILPLDGTPCADNKVCWNKECQNILYGPGPVLQETFCRLNDY
ncbi:hypothetical protein PV327_005884 [Microctonus hyperodae]|uniref:Peptidase M12B domain-containing protein n=1 Tax=Microctonus hyperodae TaxID=165561 RepID=A0AA39L013_MICHY|nr:hypothetical protein PV327_005884 [Microctonus hyperodae]